MPYVNFFMGVIKDIVMIFGFLYVTYLLALCIALGWKEGSEYHETISDTMYLERCLEIIKIEKK